jgi:hypothetical protein
VEGNLFRTLILGTIGSSNRSESESLILKIYFPWHNTLTSSRFLGPQIFGGHVPSLLLNMLKYGPGFVDGADCEVLDRFCLLCVVDLCFTHCDCSMQ